MERELGGWVLIPDPPADETEDTGQPGQEAEPPPEPQN
jgi:hypothetical protein